MLDSELESYRELTQLIILFDCNGIKFGQLLILANYTAAAIFALCLCFLFPNKKLDPIGYIQVGVV